LRARLRKLLQSCIEDVTDALLPSACRRCGASLPQRFTAAQRDARPYSALYTGALRRRLAGPLSLPLSLLCSKCCHDMRRTRGAGVLPGSPELECVTAFEPAPALFELVHALKYEACSELAPWLGAFLAAALRSAVAPLAGGVLVPVPLHVERLLQRGYNQSELLAREVQRRTGLPIADALLVRCRATAPQAQLDRELRRINVEGAFARRGPAPQGAGRVVLVDDVVTSGATVRAALAALGCDAERIVVLALCRARAAVADGAPRDASVSRGAPRLGPPPDAPHRV
jgi:ComF family protein